MPADISITVRAIRRWYAPASGEKCTVCGEPTFLKELVLLAEINNHEPQEVGCALCQSCGDCVLSK